MKPALLHYVVSPSSIAIVNRDAAFQALKGHRGDLMVAILDNHCLELASHLYAKDIIPRATVSTVSVVAKTKEEKNMALLDAIEARVLTNPSDFNALLDVLEADTVLHIFASRLRNSYHNVIPDHTCEGMLEY